MSSPKKNVAYEFDIGLVDSADTGSFKASPTIAAGDFQVSTDNGAFANLTTLPIVSPAGSLNVKVNLSQAEMNGDKIVVQCIDAAGDEWDDVLIFIDATVANVDDIVRSTTPANTLAVDANNRVDIGQWLGTAVTTSATSAKPEMDVFSVSDDSTAANNLEILFDGVEGFGSAYAGPRGPGVYLNDAAANTNTVNGVDGTWANPVSTIAAVKTIADSLGVDRIYLINNSSVTLAATMEDYEFVGIGEMSVNIVNFGTQDVDRTVFYNLLLTGAQGGTGRCQAESCCLSSITGMEITALGCLIADGGSLTLRNDCAFDACFSAVAGAGTPTLNINSVANVNVYFRHYSGGMKVTNAVATTVMSFEADGQLVVDATCTSLTVVVRGNCSITDNGTTTSLTQDAAINLTNINAEVDTALVAGQQDIAQIVRQTSGTVWFIDDEGDNSDGLTPDTAWNTALKTKIEAASAGDVVIIGPGTYAIGDAVINVPNGVSVHGSGMDATRITSTADLTVASRGPIIKPGSDSVWQDMTIHGILTDGTYQAAIGTRGGAGQAAFTNAVGRRLRLTADSDGAYVFHSSACSLTLIDCIIETKYDAIVAFAANNIVTVINTPLIVTGPSATASGESNGVVAFGNGLVRLFNCPVRVTDGGAVHTFGFYNQANGTIEVFGGSIYTSGSAGDIFDAQNLGTKLILAGVDHDRSKTSGTITYSSGLDSAMAASPLADSLMQRVQAIDVLSEVSGDGDLAAILADTGELQTNQGNWLTATGFSTHDAAAVIAALPNIYTADIQLTIDEANTRDEYTVTWYKNGVRITSGITVPKIQVVKRVDGTDLVAVTDMTQIGATGSYKYDEATDRVTAGEAAVAVVTATIDTGSRGFSKVCTRDSSA
jgi:hypothetical protein